MEHKKDDLEKLVIALKTAIETEEALEAEQYKTERTLMSSARRSWIEYAKEMLSSVGYPYEPVVYDHMPLP